MSTARAQETEAQLALGQMLWDAGDGAQAWEAFAAVARRGDARGWNMLGRLAQLGWAGQAPDPAQASGLFRKAIEAGSAWAAFNLADLYLNGSGVGRAEAEAARLYERAAEGGVVQAFNMLGLLHEEGRGVAADPERALAFFRAGAGAGDCWACFNLGRMAWAADAQASAVVWFQASVDCGFAGYWRVLLDTLGADPPPALAQVIKAARERLCRAEQVLAGTGRA